MNLTIISYVHMLLYEVFLSQTEDYCLENNPDRSAGHSISVIDLC